MTGIVGVCVAIVVISLVVTAIVELLTEYILPFFVEGWKRGRARARRRDAIVEQCSKCRLMYGPGDGWGISDGWCYMFKDPRHPCAQQQLHDDDVEISTQGETNED